MAINKRQPPPIPLITRRGIDAQGAEPIRKIANFYNAFILVLIVVFAIVFVGAIIGGTQAQDGSGYWIAAMLSVVGFLAVGATVVLLDIMHNVRAVNENTRVINEDQNITKDEEAGPGVGMPGGPWHKL